MTAYTDSIRKVVDFCQPRLSVEDAQDPVRFFAQQGVLPCFFHYEGIQSFPGFDQKGFKEAQILFAQRRLQLDNLFLVFLKHYPIEIFLVLKGKAFEKLYYPEKLQRQFSDIDIFTKDLAISSTPFFDMHVKISDMPLGKYLTYEAAADRRQLVSSPAEEFYTLSDIDNFLLMISHGSKHHWCRLRWVMDVVWFLMSDKCPPLNVLYEASVKYGLKRAMKIGVYIAAKFFPENHIAHEWLRREITAFEVKIAESFLKDLFRRRHHSLAERIRNHWRSVLMRDTIHDRICYLCNRSKHFLGI